MPQFNKHDPFYTPELPVRMVCNWLVRSWSIIDRNNVVIAKGLTKETAVVIITAMNYIDETIRLLADLYSHEDLVVYRKVDNAEKMQSREKLIRIQYQMLKDFGINVKWLGDQDYHKNLWDYFYDIITTPQQ